MSSERFENDYVRVGLLSVLNIRTVWFLSFPKSDVVQSRRRIRWRCYRPKNRSDANRIPEFGWLRKRNVLADTDRRRFSALVKCHKSILLRDFRFVLNMHSGSVFLAFPTFANDVRSLTKQWHVQT